MIELNSVNNETFHTFEIARWTRQSKQKESSRVTEMRPSMKFWTSHALEEIASEDCFIAESYYSQNKILLLKDGKFFFTIFCEISVFYAALFSCKNNKTEYFVLIENRNNSLLSNRSHSIREWWFPRKIFRFYVPFWAWGSELTPLFLPTAHNFNPFFFARGESNFFQGITFFLCMQMQGHIIRDNCNSSQIFSQVSQSTLSSWWYNITDISFLYKIYLPNLFLWI